MFVVQESTEMIDNPLHEAAKRGNIDFLNECIGNRVCHHLYSLHMWRSPVCSLVVLKEFLINLSHSAFLHWYLCRFSVSLTTVNFFHAFNVALNVQHMLILQNSNFSGSRLVYIVHLWDKVSQEMVMFSSVLWKISKQYLPTWHYRWRFFKYSSGICKGDLSELSKPAESATVDCFDMYRWLGGRKARA